MTKNVFFLLGLSFIVHLSFGQNTGFGETTPISRVQIKGNGATSATSALGVTNNNGTFLLDVKDNGYVGIGITTPNEGLHLYGKNFLIAGGTGASSNHLPLAAGPNMLFSLKKGALRAGFVNSTQWDYANVGLYSTAFGFNTIASASYATALGISTNATGLYSIAIGNSSDANGNASAAIGINLSADSYGETVIGTHNTLAISPTFDSWIPTDRLFTIGNGETSNAKSNALVMLKNGNTTLKGALTLTNGTSSFTLPQADGTAGQALITNGSGAVSWGSVSGGSSYTAGTGIAIASGVISNTGDLSATNELELPTQTGNSGKYLTTDGTNVSWGTVAGAGTSLNGAYNEGGAGAGRTITADNGAVLVNGTDGLQVIGTHGSGAALTLSGQGTRMFFYPNKSAFRAGYAYSDEWDDANIGNNSTAFGNSAIANGVNSFAIGINTIAGGGYTIATGYGTIANGEYSTSMGFETVANGVASVVMGVSTKADAFRETVIGSNNTTAYSSDSYNWVATDRLFTIGNGEDFQSPSDALVMLKNGNTTLKGALTLTNGTSSFTLPQADGTAGQVLTTDGSGVVSWGTAAGGGGALNTAYNFGGLGAGRTITADNGAVLVNGTDGLQVTGTLGSGATLTLSGQGTRMFFYPNKSAFRAGYAYSDEWDDANIGINSTAFGNSAIANGVNSFATGINTIASGGYTIATGYGTIANGEYSTSMGFETVANGTASVVMGVSTKADAYGETAIGSNNTIAYSSDSYNWVATDRLFTIGNGEDFQSPSDALVMLKNGNTTLKGALTLSNGTSSFTLPQADGTAGQVLTTDGSGVVSWGTAAGGGGALNTAYNFGGLGAGRTITADNGAVLVDGTDGFQVTGTYNSGATLALSGTGVRMFFYPRKGAFRAGGALGSNWNEANIGLYSVAMGFYTKAVGFSSTAIGNTTEASGANATAIGYFTIASGGESTTMGDHTTASAKYSTAMGVNTVANAYGETVIGINSTIASTFNPTSFVATDRLFTIGNSDSYSLRSDALVMLKNGNTTLNGALTLSNGTSSFTLPQADGTAGQVLTTDGSGVVSWGTAAGGGGSLNTAYNFGGAGAGRIITADNGAVLINGTDGLQATGVWGGGATLSLSGAGVRMFLYPKKAAFRAGEADGTEWDDANIGDNSTAMGYITKANGFVSTAMGYLTTASGKATTVIGEGTTAAALRETAIGSYNTNASSPNATNWVITDRLFTIGNGTDVNNKSDALVMLKNGNTTLKGALTLTNGTSSFTLPQADGTAGQILTTNGSGVVSWGTAAAGGGSLNTAYNFGSAGAGRTITADNGAVLVNGTDGLQVTGTLGSGATLALSGAGNRMFFYPRKAAFRAGTVSSTEWDEANIGNNSVAFGANTKASGSNSFATGFGVNSTGTTSFGTGYYINASGDYSFAAGTNLSATGNSAIATGSNNVASGNTSFALGYTTTASGNTSFASGRYTIASGTCSVAFGDSATASGSFSTAMGYQTIASGGLSTTIGYQTTASGGVSIAMGYQTTASGSISTSMGDSTIANGDFSTTMGRKTIANGDYSVAVGQRTIASAACETVIGSYNTYAVSPSAQFWSFTDRLFTIGNGYDDNSRSNALVMLKNGNTTFSGNVTGPSFSTPSDKRFKNNLTSLATVSGSALTNLASIGSYYYNYKVEEFPERQFPKDRQIGFIAQEVEAIYPELVITDEQGYKKVDYAKITPVLVEAIKELKAENDALKAKNEKFEAKFEALENAVYGNAKR
jgi:hypothetical protein